MCIFCVRGTRTQLLISVLCPVQLIGEISGDFICVDTYLPRFEALAYVSNWRKWWFVVMRSCLRKALFIFFLFVFALKGFFIFFFVGAAFATFFLARELVFDGINFVKLDENIGDCPFTSGLFTVFLAHFKKYVDIMSTIAEKCVLHTVLFLRAQMDHIFNLILLQITSFRFKKLLTTLCSLLFVTCNFENYTKIWKTKPL